MSNSSLVSYKKISPNKNSPRNHSIDTITIHCYVGQASVESAAGWFSRSDAECSCNYMIGTDGRIALIVDEKDRSWCSSSPSNDNRAITIECASDSTHPYAINDKVYSSLIKLCADICRRNNIKELKWRGDKSLIGQVDKQNMTVHRWFANKACPGDYIYNRLGKIAEEVNEMLGVEKTNGTQATAFKNLSEQDAVDKIMPLCVADMKRTGILASVTGAQFILESGYGKTVLAQNTNNCFGMKAYLSGNTWAGSTWDGTSIFTKPTQEQDTHGVSSTVVAAFRKYACVEDSIADHSAYLLGAMNGFKKRYAGLAECTDWEEAARIIKNGGYATDVEYVEKLRSIIDRFNLTEYDAGKETVAEKKWYRVRKTWVNVASQLGAFEKVDNAKKCADEHPGYTVYDDDGKIVYTSKNPDKKFPYEVKIDIDNLNIRTGPGTNYAKTGSMTGRGIFTIVEEASGEGSTSGWGRLLSGAGWISLDYAEKK